MAANQNGVKKDFLLDCLHTKVFASTYPRINELVLCFKCNAYRKVITGGSPLYSWQCTFKNCEREGSAYQRQDTAARMGSKHQNDNPSHPVMIQSNGQYLYIMPARIMLFENCQ